MRTGTIKTRKKSRGYARPHKGSGLETKKKKQFSKDSLEHCLNDVEHAVRDAFPGNSAVVNNLNEIMRLAMKGYELESSSAGDSQQPAERGSSYQLGIR